MRAVVIAVMAMLLLSSLALAGEYTFATTADEAAALAIATSQFNASRPDRAPLTMAEYFRMIVRERLGSLQVRIQHEQDRKQESAFSALPLAERQRILNQIRCRKDVC